MSSFAEYTRKKKKEEAEKGSFSDFTRLALGDDIAPFRTDPIRSGYIHTQGYKEAMQRIKDEEEKEKEEKAVLGGSGHSRGGEDIAPTTERTWFDKGAFKEKEGNFFTKSLKSNIATNVDIAENIWTGILGMGEKAVDTLAYLAPAMSVSQQAQYNPTYQFDIDEYREMQKISSDFMQKDLYDEEKVAKAIITNPVKKVGINAETQSFLGEKSDALVQSAGQLGATIGLQAVGVPWWLTTGTTSFGSEAENALEQGATYEQAGGSALITAGADILTEKLSGGIKFGGKTLDDVMLKPLTEKIANKTVRTLTNVGIDAFGEGSEEVIASVISNLGTSLYKEENIEELLTSEEAVDEYIESFIGGAVLGGGVSAITSVKSNNASDNTQEDVLTENERKVVDKVLETRIEEAETDGKKLTKADKAKLEEEVKTELQKGYIDIDTIEGVLGGETYNTYNSIVEQENTLREEIERLQSDPRPTAQSRLVEAEAELEAIEKGTEKTELKDRLSLEVQELTKSDLLSESYNEKARRSQVFEADLTKYDAKAQETVKKAVESGILNNTNKTHDFVDMIAKLSAEKGVLFDFTNNDNLKKSGFALEGVTVNGLVSGSDVVLNIDSDKALNTVVGHEITHVLEGSDLYKELQSAVIEYSKTKGDYDSRLQAIKQLYKGVENANIDNELTADLVGDYLFTDADFINSLSTTKPNVFKRIYDEIKYLYKLATAGSKEARQLEKVKKAFDKVYKETAKTDSTKADTTYSLNEFEDGRRFVEVDQEQSRFEGHDRSEYPRIAKDIINEKFNGKVIGTDNEMFVNGRGRDEYIHPSKPIKEDYIYDAKMKASAELDNLLDAGTNLRNEADGKDGHVHKNAVGGFDYYDTLFKVGDYYFEATINIENVKKGRLFKDVTKIKDVTEAIMNSYGKNPKFQFLRTSSNDIVPQNTKNSTERYSLSEDSEGHTLSKEQKEYFKDSKVVDENGQLKVMYHGTANDFTVFNPMLQGGKNGTAEGYGIYFADTNEVSDAYGGKLLKGYLNVTHPASSYEKTIKRNELVKLIKATSEAEAKKFVDDGDYDNISDALKDTWISNYVYTYDMPINKAYNDVAESIIGMSDNDMDIVQEVMSGMAIRNYESAYEFYDILKATMGIDGFVTEWENDNISSGKAQIVVAFDSNQFKNLDNTTPTKDADIRHSLGNQTAPTGKYNVYGKDIGLETPTQPVQQTVVDEYAPLTEAERVDALRDAKYKRIFKSESSNPNAKNPMDLRAPVNVEVWKRLMPQSYLFAEGNEGELEKRTNRDLFWSYIESSQYFYSLSETEAVQDILRYLKKYGYDGVILKQTEVVQETDEYAPLTEAEANERDAMQSDRLNSLNEADMPEEAEAPEHFVDTNKMVEDVVPLDEVQVLYSLAEQQQEKIAEIDSIVEAEDSIEPTQLPTVESFDTKLENYKNALEGYKTAKNTIETSFDETISKKEAEYNALKRKDTKKASDLLMQIENLKLRKNNNITNIDSKIARVESTIDKLSNGIPTKRQIYHRNIVDKIKNVFSAKGFDFDKVLENAKNKGTFASVDNTPQRFIEKSLGYKEGQILNDLTVNKVAQNETKATQWINSYTDKKTGLLAKISKEYGIKPRSKESASAQMYAEGFWVDDDGNFIKYGDEELAKDYPNEKVRENIKKLAKDERIRKIYDETLEMINTSRKRNLYPEIPKRNNYFLHFREMDDTFSKLGIPFNPNDIKLKDLPTDINGMTADLKPGQPYFASAKQRLGYKTTYDLVGGVERYLNSAKSQIYHIDDIQTLRALRNYIADTYGQAKGLESLDSMTEEEAVARIEEVYNSHLSTFAKFLNEEANILAGKTSLTDRGLEGVIGRRGIQFLDTVNRQVGSNMVGGNISSALTNTVSMVQAVAKSNKFDATKAFAQTVKNQLGSIIGKTDGFVENNPMMIRRKGIERLTKTPWESITDKGYLLMSAIDNVSSEFIARTKFNELTRKGMSEQKAHIEADKWASRILGDRSLGQQPQLYNSKMLGLITKFQLEVRNQLDSQFYDTIQDAKVSNEQVENGLIRNMKTSAKIGSTFFQLAVLQHLFGKAFESVAGYNPAFDIVEALIQVLGLDDDDESEDTVLDNLEEGFLTLLGDLPYTSTFTGGRIPISSALPIEQFITGKDDYGNEKSRLDTIKETAPYYLAPTGYGQFKKTMQGLEMFSDEHPVAGSYTKSGNLRFPIEDTPINRVKSAVFGQYASENARDYFDNERNPLKEKQIEEFASLDIPIKDYWKYREGLSEQEKLEDKFDYIASLDLPVEKKNIMINNIVDRKEAVDLTSYDDFSDYEEFDFATKNPEKYEFLQSINVSYDDYIKSDEAKEAYNWAYQNPEKYVVSKAIGEVVEYKRYTRVLGDITADKDENGKTISGSRKEKVANYINGLEADYGEKIILFKSEYPADDTYNQDIIEYLNNREDISYPEMEVILKELGFTVDTDGNIYW